MLYEWIVWCPADGETDADARRIRSADAEGAAKQWAEDDDQLSADYRIVGGHDITVCVRPEEGGEATTWIVSGEAIPHYSARKYPNSNKKVR